MISTSVGKGVHTIVLVGVVVGSVILTSEVITICISDVICVHARVTVDGRGSVIISPEISFLAGIISLNVMSGLVNDSLLCFHLLILAISIF